MAGTTQVTSYDASSVGTPWQELVKAIPTLTTSFDSIYGTVATPVPAVNQTQQPVTPTQPAASSIGITPQALMYAGLGLGAIVGVVVLIKALS